MLEAIAKKAGSLAVARMDAASEGASYQGPRGAVTMRARHVEQDVCVADVGEKGFRIVKTFARVGWRSPRSAWRWSSACSGS
jgi:hypothetical protein